MIFIGALGEISDEKTIEIKSGKGRLPRPLLTYHQSL
jgi:hypothetical protein